jgi:hypothetical protein
MIYFNAMLPSTPRFSKCSLSLRFRHTKSFTHFSYMTIPSHSWGMQQTAQLLVTKSRFLHSPVTSGLLGPNIFLIILGNLRAVKENFFLRK